MLNKKLSKSAKRNLKSRQVNTQSLSQSPSESPTEPNSTPTKSNPTKSNSLKRSKNHLSPLEYLQLNNPQMFAKNMFSQGKVVSMNADNLERHRTERKTNSYHQVISNLIKNDIIDAKTNKNIIDKCYKLIKNIIVQTKS